MTDANKDVTATVTMKQVEPKQLSINIDSQGTPSFIFSGAWVSRDILTISRLLRREYHKYQRQVRKQNMEEQE